MKTNLLILGSLLVISTSWAQPNWSNIKANFAPIYDTTVYEKPYLQPQAVGGWEDGIFMSRDGLHMYCFYTPVDILSYSGDINPNQACEFPIIAPYWRGPMVGVDTSTIIGPCNHWLHSDVAYANRNAISDSFSAWVPTDINEPLYYEGAPQSISGSGNTLDFFTYTRTTSGYVDIYIMRNVTHNPTDVGVRIDTVNVNSPSGAEDNPHIEKINDSTYVLFFDDTYNGNTNIEIYYSISTDSGYTWSSAQPVTSINSAKEEVMPHLWNDGTDWWLYYSTSDPTVSSDGRLNIVRRKQITPNDWLNWGSIEVVINPGQINGNYGEVFGVGEPTLTQWGDISFSVVYGDVNSNDTTDMFDSDPWFLPKKGSPLAGLNEAINSTTVNIYPNPTNENINISSEDAIQHIKLRNALGQDLITINNVQKIQTLSLKDLPTGMYFIEIKTDNNQLITKKIIRE